MPPRRAAISSVALGLGLALFLGLRPATPAPAGPGAIPELARTDESRLTRPAGGRDRPSSESSGSLGWSRESVTLADEEPQPPRELRYDHDGTFEDAFCFQLGGVAPPYYGAFAEAFAGRREDYLIHDIVLWVTQVGDWGGEPLDLYVWEGGMSGPPGLVLYHGSGRTLASVPMWPLVAENRLRLASPLPDGDFAVGYWADFAGEACTWYVAADRTGEPGHPWVNVAPGIGFPTGWHHPEVLWPPPVRSLGIGVVVVPFGTGVAERDPEGDLRGEPVISTWGQIKELNR
jgi:hypothetical protein